MSDSGFVDFGGNPRPAAFAVNGAAGGTLEFGPTGDWNTWATSTLKVTLRAGNNTLRITANTGAGGPNVDYVDVAPVASTPCEAEHRTAANAAVNADNYAGFSGSGFVDLGGNGSWIEWNNVCAAANSSRSCAP